MSLLREIQSALLSDDASIGPLLLKLRLLASKLGIETLEEWVKYEAEGYPPEIDVPSYRKIGIAYTGTFFGPFGSAIKNIPIATYLIEKYAGEKWVSYSFRQSAASVDDLIGSSSNGEGSLSLEASNLTLLLNGKVYPDYSCNAVYGHVSKVALVEIQNAIRSRILELTIQLEKSSPNSSTISLADSLPAGDIARVKEATPHIQQIIYGNYTAINSSGDNNAINVSVVTGDIESLISTLKQAGIAEADAKSLADILKSEKPEANSSPFGKRAREWLAKNIGKAMDGTWKVGIAVASKIIEAAVKKYYGLN